MQARFWIYTTSPVRVKLNPGQTLTWHHFQRTDEGYSAESQTWTFNDQGVEREWVNDGRDCDGRLTQSGRDFCPIDALAAGNEFEGITYPSWQDAEREQRDEYAEAAGY